MVRRTFGRLHFSLAAVFAFVVNAFSQSVEVGFVKEYNGADTKTPLAGVELNIPGAPSTVSGADGSYELRFSVLRPGDPVSYNEIYKSGYVLFNLESVKAWRISNNRTPFVIVMCNERKFRELKAHYYNLFDKSYKREYEEAIQNVKKVSAELKESERVLQNKLAQLEKDYRDKLNDINTYVEVFARIDRSEMSTIESQALNLIDEGRIEEGIKLYEQLDIRRKAEEQMAKLSAGQALVQAGQTMIETSQSDLQVIAEKLKTQIGIYEMGGIRYELEKEKCIAQIVDIYKTLKELFGNRYDEDLGKWMVQQDKYDLDNLKAAAALPSPDGLFALGTAYEILSDVTDSLYEEALECYWKAAAFHQEDSLENDELSLAQKYLWLLPSFNLSLDGNRLYFRQLRSLEDAVLVCPKGLFAEKNDCSGNLVIPSSVSFQGKRYEVWGIDSYAFSGAKRLQSVTIPSSVTFIGANAFQGSGLQYCVINCSELLEPEVSAFPKSTVFFLPDNALEDEQYYRWMSRVQAEYTQDDISAYPAAYVSVTEFLANSPLSGASQGRAADYYALAQLFSSSGSSVYDFDKSVHYGLLLTDLLSELHVDEQTRLYAYLLMIRIYASPDSPYTDQAMAYANKALELPGLPQGWVLKMIAEEFHQKSDFSHAADYYRAAVEQGANDAYNNLAYLYAYGHGVQQDLSKAHELIDRAILQAPEEHDYYDSKGEFFLLGRDTLQARHYLQQAENILSQSGDEAELKKYQEGSVLYQTLNPDTAPDPALAGELGNYLSIVQAVARIEEKRLAEIDFNSIFTYEEIYSIGIIALQVIIKNTPPEQLARRHPLYYAAAVRWAIQNDMARRYPKICYFFCYSPSISGYSNRRDQDAAGREKVDLSDLSVWIQLVQAATEIEKDVSGLEVLSPGLREIVSYAHLINDTLDGWADPIDKNIIRSALEGYQGKKGSGFESIGSIAETYHLPWGEVFGKMKGFQEEVRKRSDRND